MLAALLVPDIPHMGEYLLWLLVGTGLCLLVGWKFYRRRSDALRIDEQVERDAAARAEAQRQAEGQAEDERLAGERAEAARIEAEVLRQAAERAESDRIAALEAEAHAEAQRQAERRAEEERLQAERLATERAEQERIAHALQRAAAERAEQAEKVERERLAALEAELEAQRQAQQQAEAMRLAAERAEAERIAAERRREAAALADAQAAAQAERERLAALEAQREAQAHAQAQQLAALRAEQERQAASRAAAAVPRRAGKTAAQTLVLLADDSKVVRIKTGRLLAQHQYQVAYAIDGLDAVQQMQTQRPDVLITDVEMPGMDGFELTRHIRADPQTAQLPVIMITAADDRHREQADAAGVSVLLGKPYPEDALIAHIRLAMGHDAAAPLAAATSAHAALDTVA